MDHQKIITGHQYPAATERKRHRHGDSDPLSSSLSERRYVTVLFSDLVGFTSMSEALDPEEVREIMGRILKIAGDTIRLHGGWIEKFLGDAVMAVFGKGKVYEDDPIRAIKAAMGIHAKVRELNPLFYNKYSLPHELMMHSGINTGITVTGDLDMEQGVEGILGDTVNLASRLAGLAGPDNILVGPETWARSQGYFIFESLKPVIIKGKIKPVSAYKFISARKQITSIHRVTGLRSSFIGRDMPLNEINAALEQLQEGFSNNIMIYGSAGVGKSRLIEEFRNQVSDNTVNWYQGNAYPSTQGVPYSIFSDMLRRAWHIEEIDTAQTVKDIITGEVARTLPDATDSSLYLGYLLGLVGDESDKMSPRSRKQECMRSIQRLIDALCKHSYSVICVENIHWGDTASLELLKNLIRKSDIPRLLICSYTVPFSLFDSSPEDNVGKYPCKYIELGDLAESEIRSMIRSLLDDESIPEDLVKFIVANAGGNPFYLEELINSLVESGTLVCQEKQWKLNCPVRYAGIPSTVNGIISARLDRLDEKSNKMLREASVIGRVIPYEILKKITSDVTSLDDSLSILEQADFLRPDPSSPSTTYLFKNTLLQESVYYGLLKSERQALHEKVARVMETTFSDRLNEYFEVLAHHYRLADILEKAAEYLVLSAEKSLGQHQIEESHEYFSEAFELLKSRPVENPEHNESILRLINRWAIVHFYNWKFDQLLDLLKAHESMIETSSDVSIKGMFYAWFGKALHYRDNNAQAILYLKKAVRYARSVNDIQILGNVSSSLLYIYKETSDFKNAIRYGKMALDSTRYAVIDPVIYTRSLIGLGDVYYYTGNIKELTAIGKELLNYVHKNAGNEHIIAAARMCMGMADLVSGDLIRAMDAFQQAITAALSPLYSKWPCYWLAVTYIKNRQYPEAGKILDDLLTSQIVNGDLKLTGLCSGLKGLVLCHENRLRVGLARIDDSIALFTRLNARTYVVQFEWLLAAASFHQVKLQEAATRTRIRQDVYLNRVVEVHLKNVVSSAETLGALGLLGPACMDLAAYYVHHGYAVRARDYYLRAKACFETTGAGSYLSDVEKVLSSR